MAIRVNKRVTTSSNSWLNLSKSGPSLSVGKRGKSVNFGSRGITTNFRIPGTQMSFRKTFSGKRQGINPNTLSKEDKNLAFLYMWRISIWILAIFLFFGFLIGGNIEWSLGAVLLAVIGTYFINKKIKKANNTK